MTPEEIKDLEARAEEYARDFAGSFYTGGEAAVQRISYIAGARAQHEITRKATIDEVLELLRSEGVKAPNGRLICASGGYWADWLEQKMKAGK